MSPSKGVLTKQTTSNFTVVFKPKEISTLKNNLYLLINKEKSEKLKIELKGIGVGSNADLGTELKFSAKVL